MTEQELLTIINKGELSKAQFKECPPQPDNFTDEIEIIDTSIKDMDTRLFSDIRNNQLAMFASRTMPYSGLGSGIRRAYAEQPDMELVNDVEGEQFIVKFPRVC